MTAHRSQPVRWLPALLLITLCIVSAFGARLTARDAQAAVVNVQGSITSSIFIDASACAPTALNIGTIIPGDPWKTARTAGGTDCGIAFGSTNNPAGASLTAFEDPAAVQSPAAAMKCLTAACTGHALSDYDGASEPVAGTSAFGAQLLGATTPATPTWSVSPAVHAVANSATTACTTTSVGSGTCRFTFGASASGSDMTGDYQARMQFLVLPN